ncbi:MAG: energy transducer TonB [Hyphomonas sp.]
MLVKIGAVCAAAILLVSAASAEGCQEKKFRGKGLTLARKAYSQLMLQQDELDFTREDLVKARAEEPSCLGQSSLDYIMAIMDVDNAGLEQAVGAMAVILRADTSGVERRRMMNRLIQRFVAAHEIRTAIELARLGKEHFPEEGNFDSQRVLLLAGIGEFAEARALGDATMEESWDEESSTPVPYEAWVRLAVSEISGDKEDEAGVIEQMTEHLGPDTQLLLTQYRPSANYEMLVSRLYDPDFGPDPIVPPQPSYPYRMARDGKEGLCEVRFTVTPDGVPENIRATCSEDGFKQESERAVGEVRFTPVVMDGIPRYTFNVVYPLEYRLR